MYGMVEVASLQTEQVCLLITQPEFWGPKPGQQGALCQPPGCHSACHLIVEIIFFYLFKVGKLHINHQTKLDWE